jgi:hypothetical protein
LAISKFGGGRAQVFETSPSRSCTMITNSAKIGAAEWKCLEKKEADTFFFIDIIDSRHSQVDSKESYSREWITLLSYIQMVLDLNLEPETGYSDWGFPWCFSVLPKKC